MRRTAFLRMVALGGGLLVAGCGKKPAVPDINVGLLAELTGDIAAVGVSARNGAELAAFDVNEGGGIRVGEEIHGIRLIIEDTGGQAARAAEGAKRLIDEEKVVAIIGPSASLGAVPAAQVAETSKVLLISPWSTAPKLTVDEATGQPRKYVYRVCFTDAFQGKFLAKYAVDFARAKTAAVLYEGASEAPHSQAEIFKKEFEALGGTVPYFETYETGTKDFAEAMKKIAEAKVDVVLLPNYYGDVAVQLTQARAAGIKAAIVGSDNWNVEQLLRRAPKEVEGTSFLAHYFTGARVDAVAKFVTTYKNKYGQPPDDVAALAYDAVILLSRALEAGGAIERESIRDGIAKIPTFDGVTGKMTFRSPDPIKGGAMLRVSGGKVEFITSIDP